MVNEVLAIYDATKNNRLDSISDDLINPAQKQELRQKRKVCDQFVDGLV